MKHQNLLGLVFVVPFVYAIDGCNVDDAQPGLIVDYYDDVQDLPYWLVSTEMDADGRSYMNQMAGMTPSDTVYGVTDNLHFEYNNISYAGEYEDIYGRTTNVGWFGLRLSGYFKAPTTGQYVISLPDQKNDNIASGGIGSGNSFGCCEGPSNSTENFQLYSFLNDKSATKTTVFSVDVTMQAGIYYPIELLYYQGGPTEANFTFEVTYPDGSVHDTDLPFYYVVDNGAKAGTCWTTTTTTDYWTGSYTSTETITPTGVNGTETIIIEDPPTTITTEGSDSATVTTTLSGGQPEIIVHTHPNTVTTTSYWSEPYASTTTFTPSGYSVATVVVEEPPISTTTITGSSATTYTSVFTDGSTATSEVVVVTTVPDISTTTITGSSTTTYTSVITGGSVTTTEVVVVTPTLYYGNSTVTSTTPSSPTTITTVVTATVAGAIPSTYTFTSTYTQTAPEVDTIITTFIPNGGVATVTTIVTGIVPGDSSEESGFSSALESHLGSTPVSVLDFEGAATKAITPLLLILVSLVSWVV